MPPCWRSWTRPWEPNPYLEPEDITEALAYAAWRSDEFEVPISPK